MKRGVFVLAAALWLGACSGAASDRDVIAKTCVGDGGDGKVCDCLARASVRRLEAPALDAVVLGAQGQDSEADRLLAGLTPEQGTKFRAAMEGIVRECGAEDYLRPS